ncbi:TauD/TfdA family dioxygenase [Streptomyces sp. NPDC056661]|uniref:TauD/TfdA family dioxygenase n=1 Tax=Streptomyces sp. NPDC056661 TaxID=3345898 RepID=UPI0036AACE7E
MDITVHHLDLTTGLGSQPSAAACDALLSAVRNEGLAIIRDFPPEPDSLIALGKMLGRPQPRYPLGPEPAPDDGALTWVTDVRFRPRQADEAHQPFTHRSSELQLHTARAAATVQPRLFMMLMADPGRPSGEPDNGQSQLSRLDDALHRLSDMYGRRPAEEIVRVLATVPISTEDPYPETPVVRPILHRAVDGRWAFRYWENIHAHAVSTSSEECVEALKKFDQALRNVRFEVSLRRGDVILLDNDRVAHARRKFPGWSLDGSGRRVPSSRLIYNLHVFSDLS